MTAQIVSREQITAIVTEHLAAELDTPAAEINGGDALKELPNSDSMKLLRVVSKLERNWDVEFDDQSIFAVNTVDELVTLVHGYVSGQLTASS